jgi:hypothetical protein
LIQALIYNISDVQPQDRVNLLSKVTAAAAAAELPKRRRLQLNFEQH